MENTELNHVIHYPLDFINYIKDLTRGFGGVERPEAFSFRVPFVALDTITTVVDSSDKIKFWLKTSELRGWIRQLSKINVDEIAGAEIFYIAGLSSPVLGVTQQHIKGAATKPDGYEAGIKIIYKTNNHAKRVN